MKTHLLMFFIFNFFIIILATDTSVKRDVTDLERRSSYCSSSGQSCRYRRCCGNLHCSNRGYCKRPSRQMYCGQRNDYCGYDRGCCGGYECRLNKCVRRDRGNNGDGNGNNRGNNRCIQIGQQCQNGRKCCDGGFCQNGRCSLILHSPAPTPDQGGDNGGGSQGRNPPQQQCTAIGQSCAFENPAACCSNCCARSTIPGQGPVCTDCGL